MSNIIELKIPDIGGHEGVDVIEVLVKAGDTIDKEQSLVTLETDKATMEVPATAAGVVKEVKVKVGDKVSEGSVVLLLEASEAAAAPAPAAAAPTPAAPAPAPAAQPAAAPAAAQRIEVRVPDIGGHDNVDVIEVLVKAGDTIEKEQSLITLETDKATMEVPATAAGVVESVAIKVGDKVSEGALILVVQGSAAA
ncbi:biotin/lipoyl-containing protein, partial [Chitiniphilus shinanonensis]|uniref:biotin/lipoyl-containing protein n=1 Tax=Chitiniphilus shinanonensis TaxID=553088 RepID=UPI003341F91E